MTPKQLANTRFTLSPVNGLGPTDASQLATPDTLGTRVITAALPDGSGFVNIHIPAACGIWCLIYLILLLLLLLMSMLVAASLML